MTDNATSIPVLICSYNRPDKLSKLLDTLENLNVSNLYFFSDGPEGTGSNRIDQCRKMFLSRNKSIPAERIKLEDNHLGCRQGMAAAISWFFSMVDFGIILEDDCIPSLDFFNFVADSRNLIGPNSKIFCITGTRNLGTPGAEVLISNFPFIWGWATSAEKWSRYKLDYNDASDLSWRKAQEFKKSAKMKYHTLFYLFWREILNLGGKGNFDTWDYSLIATLWRENQFCLVPADNLVTNIGFDSEATHTKDLPPSWVSRKAATKIFRYDKAPLTVNWEFELWTNKEVYGCSVRKLLHLSVGRFMRKNS